MKRLELETKKKAEAFASYRYSVDVFHYLLSIMKQKGMFSIDEILRFAVHINTSIPVDATLQAIKTAHVAIQTATLIGMKLYGVENWLDLARQYDEYKAELVKTS